MDIEIKGRKDINFILIDHRTVTRKYNDKNLLCYECSECKTCFPSIKRIENHLKKVKNCDIKKKEKEDLIKFFNNNNYVVIIDGKTYYKCPEFTCNNNKVCQFDDMRRHYLICPGNKTEIINSYTLKDIGNRHFSVTHPNKNEIRQIYSKRINKKTRYFCNLCDHYGNQKKDILIHFDKTNNCLQEKKDRDKEDKEFEKMKLKIGNKTKYKCCYCDKICRDKHALRNHYSGKQGCKIKNEKKNEN